MKKFLVSCITLSVLACSTVYALDENISPNQCPPASALTHKDFGAHWEISDTYKKLGWYVSNFPHSDLTAATYLKDDVMVQAFLKSNEDKKHPNWFPTCEYDVTDMAYTCFPRKIVVTKNQLLKGAPPLPNFIFDNEPYHYRCDVDNLNKSKCAWDSIA